MGAMCASSTINLPSYGETLGGEQRFQLGFPQEAEVYLNNPQN